MSNENETRDEDLDDDIPDDETEEVQQIPVSHGGGTISVQNGVTKQIINLNPNEELTVGDVREKLGDIMNIPPNAIAVITGREQEATDGEQLLPGNTLVFVKRSASKG